MSFIQSFYCPAHENFAAMDLDDLVRPSEYVVSMRGLPEFLQIFGDPSGIETTKNRGKCGKYETKSGDDKDGFQMNLDVRQFKPNEISVKTVDNSIIVEAKHEEKQDADGYISRQFTRRYVLPERYRAEDVESSLSSDGILTVKASPPPAIMGNIRHIEIQQTGPARRNINTNKTANDAEKTNEKTNGTTKNDTNK